MDDPDVRISLRVNLNSRLFKIENEHKTTIWPAIVRWTRSIYQSKPCDFAFTIDGDHHGPQQHRVKYFMSDIEPV